MEDGASSKTKEESCGSDSYSIVKSTLSHSSPENDLEIDLGEGTTVIGAELRAILIKQLVYVSGGLQEDKYPILTFPEEGLLCLDDPDGFNELNTTLLYFKTLTCFADLSAGTTLLLDARNSRTHGAVTQLLDKLASKEIVLDVYVVYIYIKSGIFAIFGRSKQLAGAEAASKLKIEYLSDQKSLLDKLDSTNLTTDLGGTLCYDHSNWVHKRLEYERIQQMHGDTMKLYPKFTDALDHCELPKTIRDAENWMKVDTELKEAFANKMTETLFSVDEFLETLQHQQAETSMQMALDTKEHIKLMSSLKLMSQDLREMQKQLVSFWMVHKAHMDHWTQICHFNERAEEMRVLLNKYTINVNMEGAFLGDTLESALEHGEKYEELVTNLKTNLDENMAKMYKDAQALVDPSCVSEEKGKMHAATQQATDSVKAQVEELKKSYRKLDDLCQQKRELFIVCVKFHMMTRQVLQWKDEVLEFLASLYLEEMSHKEASASLNKIEDFENDIQDSQLETIAELANSLPTEKHFKKVAGNVKEKYEQACGLLEVRKSHILKKLAVLQSHESPPTLDEEQEKVVEVTDSSGPDQEPVQSVPIISTEESSLITIPLKDEPTESTDGESDVNVLKKRQFVYKELITTEKVYIEDLKTVLNSYYDAMDPENNTSIPLRLRDKRHVVFGNLPEIHKFHETVALEEYEDHPEKVGECFLKFMEQFQMYSVYCKTKTQSEALVSECTESQAFFKGLQLNLAHQLPLDSYLIKPVQRITKYQLLLKDMMKHSVKAKVAHSELKKALDGMLKVLKNLNDSLHVVGLKGFPGSLAEQGRLLVHDPFQMWEKTNSSRSFKFSRARERHVFLFEKMIIFSKKTEVLIQKKEKKSENYLYKGHLTMAEIGMRPIIDGQPLQFDLSLHGQSKVFTFQAQSKEIYDMWTSEIKRLLEAQLILMKDIVIKSGTLDRKKYKGKAKLSTDSRESWFFAEPMETQSLMPGQAKVKRQKSILSSSAESSLHSLQPRSLKPAMGRDNAASDEELDEIGTGMVMDHFETLAPSAPHHYLAICDYNPGDSDENCIPLTECQEVEAIGINQYGWWWVRATNASSGEVEEGWIPAGYLKTLTHTQGLKN